MASTARRCTSCGYTKADWTFRVDVGVRNGRRVQQRGAGFRTRKEALAAERLLIAAVERRQHVMRDRVTVGAWLEDEWLPAVRPQLKQNTWLTYRDTVRAHISPHIGDLVLQDLAARDVVQMRDTLLEAGSRLGGPLSPKTVRHAMIVLGAACTYAVRIRVLLANPCSGVPAPRVPRGAPPPTWSAAELQQWLAHVADHDVYAAWVLAATAALRRGELAGLRWPDILLEEQCLYVSRARVSGSGGVVLLDDEKSVASRRAVALDPITCEVLRRHRSAWESWRKVAGAAWADDDESVFVWRNGAPIHPERFTKWFAQSCREVGLRNIRLHGLRHSWATLALEQGIDVRVVAEQLGHSSTSVTRDLYQHPSSRYAVAAATQVASTFLPMPRD